jgi:hypothetical protein
MKNRRSSPEVTPELTADAVRLALGNAGFAAAQKQPGGEAISAGFQVYEILLLEPEKPRIVVQWHAGDSAPELEARQPGQFLGTCAQVLAEAGYQTKWQLDGQGEYLVVWVHGEF